jgi:biopolymer transport protein ExbB
VTSQVGTSFSDFVAGDRSYSIVELFQMGGFIMWLLLLFSILAVVVFIVCLLTTSGRYVLPIGLVDRVETCIRRRDYNGLNLICEGNDSCFGKVMLATSEFLQKNQQANIEEIREVAAAEAGRQASMLTRQISWLSDIGALAPMLGLLGTVVGMMRTFFEISNGNFEGVKQMQMAGGVAEALITTAGGLMLGIPVLLCYAYFRSRISKRISDLEAAITHSLVAVSVLLDREKTLPDNGIGMSEERLPVLDMDRSSHREIRGL